MAGQFDDETPETFEIVPVDPKCPGCDVRGREYFVTHKSAEENGAGEPWFEIVACARCGHVYGVIAKVVNARDVRTP